MSASTEKKNRQAAREAGTDKKMLAAQEAARKKAQSKRRWTIGTILVVLLIAAILFLNSGFLYTGTTALTVGERKYSPAEVNYRYANDYLNFANQYGSYASVFGLDTSTGLAGLDDQSCPMLEDGTWKDYFLDSASISLMETTALYDYAVANGIALDDEDVAQVDAGFSGIEEYAKTLGYANANAMLAANYGNGVTQKLARQAQLENALANKAYNQVLDGFSYSAEELEDYYRSLEGSKDQFTFLSCFVPAETVESESEDGEVTVAEPTAEAVAEAKATAEAIAAAYRDGEESDPAERFRAAAAPLLGDEAVSDRLLAGSSLPEFYSDWLKDAARKAGDITVSEDPDGDAYHVVLFLERSDNHYPLAQFRHILIKAEADEDGSYSDEAKAAAKARAEEILAEWKAGEQTEDSFAALAELYSEDAGSNTNGGLYDAVSKGEMVPEVDAFCFEGHKHGDTAVVYGESISYAGYHVMYYVGEGELYSDSLARSDLRSSDMNDFLAELESGYETVPGPFYKLVG